MIKITFSQITFFVCYTQRHPGIFIGKFLRKVIKERGTKIDASHQN